ncbi:MAG: glucokinase [Rhodocyclaceae bacterium]|nr:glucokinase [Rhodocyclaceae bacterium]
MLICGDIGGTKALLGIAEVAGGRPYFTCVRRYACADFADFPALFAQFRQDAATDAGALAGGCLAVAGPIADDGLTAKITNLPWSVDAAHCGAVFGLPPLGLANDFAAAALGVAAAAPEHLVTLQAGAPLAAAPRLVVGAGTGLGMAVLLPETHGRWRILPGEGGHTGFAPQDETQARIHAALLAEHGRVTSERVISGPGLAAIHRILAGAALDPAVIAERALANSDSAERRSLDVFLAAYGAYAGDMALTVMARGGVYLAGGIAAKILPLMHAGGFIAAFGAKAEHAALAARMPVHVVTDPEFGLKGAALIGDSLLDTSELFA